MAPLVESPRSRADAVFLGAKGLFVTSTQKNMPFEKLVSGQFKSIRLNSSRSISQETARCYK
jgi:hypothetical protein